MLAFSNQALDILMIGAVVTGTAFVFSAVHGAQKRAADLRARMNQARTFSGGRLR